jgi:CheY-like chemotaxis protein
MAGSRHILFVEDDRAISEMYSRILIKNGYEVDFAYDGAEGLQKAQQKHYDLILLDIMMPEMTGLEVLEKLRGEDGSGSPDTKIIVLTNFAQDETSDKAQEDHADGFIVKADVVPSQLIILLEKFFA